MGKQFKVIPLKLFYYQTCFETWRNWHSWYEHWKNTIKNGVSVLVYASAGSKNGVFVLVAYWKFESPSYRIKSWLLGKRKVLCWKQSLIYWHKQYSFIISCFWLLGCGNIASFWTVPWFAWSHHLGQNTPSWGLFKKKKSCSTIKLFSFFKYFLY